VSDDQQKLSFYQTVLGDGVRCVVGLMAGQQPIQKFQTSIPALMAQVDAFHQQRRDVYFTVAGLIAKGNRKAPNAKSMRALFIDLDCGPDKPYAHQTDAAAALMGFVRAGALPSPSWVVNTGGGLHAYWCADEAIAPDEWQPLATALRDYTVAIGLHIDGGITVDKVRIMRAPDTCNWKLANKPRATRILTPLPGKNPTIYSWDFLRAAFAATANVRINTALVQNRTALSNAGMASAFGNDLGDEWEGWANPERTRVGYRMENLQHHCPLVADIASVRGAGVPEPVWFRALALAAYCEDGEEWAMGPLSDAYAGFDPVETRQKFQRTRDEASKPGNNFGPPTCKTFNTVSPVCATCRHFPNWSTKPGYPWRAAALPTALKDPDGQIILPPDWLPAGFRRLASGHVVALVQEDSEDSDGNTTVRTVEADFTNEMPRDFQLVVKEVVTREGEKSLRPHIKMLSDSNANGTILIDANRLSTGSSNTLESTFVGAGLNVKIGGFEHMRNFSMQLFEAMEVNRLNAGLAYPDPEGASRLGFNRDLTTFNVGGRVLRKGQAIPHHAAIPVISTGNPVNAMLAPVGSEEQSLHFLRRVMNGLPAIMSLPIAAALVSPLLMLIGVPGFLLLMASTLTGTGKTTILKAAASLWGEAKKLVLGSSSSILGHQKYMSILSPFAAFLDEMRFASGDSRKRNAPGAFDHMALKSLTEGGNSAKMTQTGGMREAMHWMAITIAASNDSLTQALNDEDASTLATTARTMEICPDNYLKQDLVLDLGLNLGLEQNGGFVGPRFAQIVLDNYTGPQLLKAIENATAILLQKLGMSVVPPELRFRLPIMALMLVGANIAFKHGLLPFRMKELITQVSDELRRFSAVEHEEAKSSDNNADNTYDLLLNFALRQPGLNITTLKGCSPIVPERTTEAARAHINLDAGLIYIRGTDLKVARNTGTLSKVRLNTLFDLGQRIGKHMDYKVVTYGKGTPHEVTSSRCVVLAIPPEMLASQTEMMRTMRAGLPTA
jgi:hypothetical protein